MSETAELFEALDAVLADQFGTAAVLTTASGDTVVVASRHGQSARRVDGPYATQAQQEEEFVLYGEFPRPSPGDTLAIDGETWSVTDEGLLEYHAGRLARIRGHQLRATGHGRRTEHVL